MLRLLKISNRAFSLDHSGLKPDVTTSGVRNFKLPGKPKIEGYLNGSSLPKGSPTVIMIHEWWGFNKSITQTADIFAAKDIKVCVPDLYRGEAANSA